MIIMFHYVKKNFNYYHFDTTKFEEFVKENCHNIISLKEYLNNSKDQDEKIVLSFDDGTLDHYENVFPILKKYKVTGVFSVCDNIKNKKILDIQKIHYLIEKVGIHKIFSDLFWLLHLNDKDKIIEKYKTEENFIKKVLQKELPKNKRKAILNKLLKINNLNLSFDMLYLNLDMINEMQALGNEFVYHTKDHCWLSSLEKDQQIKQIKNILTFIKKYKFLSAITFPFGDFNDETMQILKNFGIDISLGINYNTSNKCLARVDCSVLK